MAKRTAIIDIGSNSISLVVYERSSRFAFHLIKKARASVKIGEGAYENGGVLQKEAMDKAYIALSDLLQISKNLKCRKILTVATSALRDAPNKGEFLQRVRDGLNLNLKVIDGKREAYFGGVATANLLFDIDEFTMVDIGGGSTEFAYIKNGKVIETYSLDLGTVRLKELFFDKGATKDTLEKYIDSTILSIPKIFKNKTVVGIGGSIRALSSVIMTKERYPLEILHGFEYRVKDHKKLIKEIPTLNDKELKKLDFPTNRLDTIREGASIFYRVLKELDAKYVIASKAGVREGVYLSDLLRNSNHRFPVNFNISIKSLIDRYSLNEKNCSFVQRVSKDLFNVLAPLHDLDELYREYLGFCAKLSPLSSRFNIYSNNENSFYFLLENLNFSFSHEEKLLIALLLKLSSKEKKRYEDYKRYEILLPDKEVMEWLYFILSLSKCINSNRMIQKVEFKLQKRELTIYMQESILCMECVEKLKAPQKIKLKFSS